MDFKKFLTKNRNHRQLSKNLENGTCLEHDQQNRRIIIFFDDLEDFKKFLAKNRNQLNKSKEFGKWENYTSLINMKDEGKIVR